MARRSGCWAEAWAALLRMAKGYRILGSRLRTRLGEIDLLAQKGPVLAAVEVKSRATLEAAFAAVTPEQRDRLRRAGQAAAGPSASQGPGRTSGPDPGPPAAPPARRLERRLMGERR